MKRVDGFDIYGQEGRALEFAILALILAVTVAAALDGGLRNAIIFGCFMVAIAVSMGFRTVRRVWLSDEELRLDTLFASYTVPWSAVDRMTMIPLTPALIKLRGVRFPFTLHWDIKGYKEVVCRISKKVPTRT